MRLPFLSTRGNSGATTADESSIIPETRVSSQQGNCFTRTSRTSSQYETAALHYAEVSTVFVSLGCVAVKTRDTLLTSRTTVLRTFPKNTHEFMCKWNECLPK
jgi:hypothetical protein